MLKIYTSEDIGRFKFYKTGGKFMNTKPGVNS